MQLAKARREPQRGPGNHYCGALSQPYSVCADSEIEKDKRGERCPLTIRLEVWGSIVSCPGGVRGSAENGFYAYFRSERNHLEHPFQYL